MKRAQPPLDLTFNPLVFVLAQVRISPVLKMSDYLPAIQEKLRLMGFPRFQALHQEEIILGPQQRMARTTVRWLFSDKDGIGSVMLAPDFVIYQVAAYVSFDAFSKTLADILRVISEETKVSLSERLGLRYINLLKPEGTERFEDYLQAGLLGLAAEKIASKKVQFIFEERGTTDLGTLVIRLFRNDNGKILPPDIEPFDMKLRATGKEGESVAILDIDHFSPIRRDFVVETLIDELWKLHDFTDGAFRAAVTTKALDKWKTKTLA